MKREDFIRDVDNIIRMTASLIDAYADDPEWISKYRKPNMEKIDNLLDYRLKLMYCHIPND